jgi:hypothetical protein
VIDMEASCLGGRMLAERPPLSNGRAQLVR